MRTSRSVIARLGWSLLTAVCLAGTSNLQAQTRTNQSRVNVNSADAATLQSLPGIGPTLAQRIIDGRPYESAADLEKVKGLSKPKIAALKDQILFGPTAGTKTNALANPAVAKTAPGTNTATAKPKNAAQSNRTQAASETASGAVPDKEAQPGQSKSGSRASAKLAPGQKVNINKASFKELGELPGIGPTKAQAIIDYRTQNGPFKSIDDIQKVKGIKQGSFSKLKEYIKIAD